MNLAPLPDLGWAAIGLMIGLWALVISFPAIVLIEAVVFWYTIRPGNSFWHSAGAALIVNLVSGGLGYLGVMFEILVWFPPPVLDYLDEYMMMVSPPYIAGVVLLLTMLLNFWALSILVEGAVLMLMKRFWPSLSISRAWGATVLANTCSYLALFVAIIVWAAVA